MILRRNKANELERTSLPLKQYGKISLSIDINPINNFLFIKKNIDGRWRILVYGLKDAAKVSQKWTSAVLQEGSTFEL